MSVSLQEAKSVAAVCPNLWGFSSSFMLLELIHPLVVVQVNLMVSIRTEPK